MTVKRRASKKAISSNELEELAFICIKEGG